MTKPLPTCDGCGKVITVTPWITGSGYVTHPNPRCFDARGNCHTREENNDGR